MDAKNLKVGINTLISAMITIVGLAGVWFTLTGEVNILRLDQKHIKEDVSHLKTEQKEGEKNFVDFKVEIKDQMHKDKLEILKAIHEHEHK